MFIRPTRVIRVLFNATITLAEQAISTIGGDETFPGGDGTATGAIRRVIEVDETFFEGDVTAI